MQAFFFDASRLRNAFAPRKPRHPLVRVALGLLGVAVLLVLVFASVFVGVAMLTAGVLLRLWKQRGKPLARDRRAFDGTAFDGRAFDGTIVDAEFRVVGKTALPSA